MGRSAWSLHRIANEQEEIAAATSASAIATIKLHDLVRFLPEITVNGEIGISSSPSIYIENETWNVKLDDREIHQLRRP